MSAWRISGSISSRTRWGRKRGSPGDRTDAQITTRLSALADTLQLPPGAELITIIRDPRTITISSDYDEIITLPLKKEHVIHFHPVVMSRL